MMKLELVVHMDTEGARNENVTDTDNLVAMNELAVLLVGEDMQTAGMGKLVLLRKDMEVGDMDLYHQAVAAVRKLEEEVADNHYKGMACYYCTDNYPSISLQYSVMIK